MQICNFGRLTWWLTRKSQPRSQPKHYENKKRQTKPFVAFCRNEATRTPDPYVPNVVRYQLRYIPPQLLQRAKKHIKRPIKLNYFHGAYHPFCNIYSANIYQKRDKWKFLKVFYQNACTIQKLALPLHSQTRRCHSSVGRAKDWKSLCPRFDSWWHHLHKTLMT